MNKVILIGRLTADPELRFLPGNGRAVSNFSLAVDKDLSRDKKQEFEQQGKPTADFIRIVVFGRSAENCANYLAKGRLVAVDGRLQTRSYENAQGQRVYITEVLANSVEFLEWGDNNSAGNKRENNKGSNDSMDFSAAEGFQPVDDDDIPF
ncbi:single-stranded DNA-binding protein [Clostridium sp. D2Q-11]|uniref:Single-stranded DNA-binding protein n=1 Tax=Anaeromonas frigoriresistens TaxID=2683708 RepID=A0A942UPU0_9FIRM|nr:single-stranded DNA-binding protein [Anaeromonas frigoriresistens]MBS4536973.1 single-stranded DNA-binding protein [Anaeromonas frigoriresistens]